MTPLKPPIWRRLPSEENGKKIPTKRNSTGNRNSVFNGSKRVIKILLSSTDLLLSTGVETTSLPSWTTTINWSMMLIV